MLAQAQALVREEYVETTDWNAFDAIAAKAQETLAAKNSQSELDEAIQALQTAIVALLKNPVLDATLLDLVLDKAAAVDPGSFPLQAMISLKLKTDQAASVRTQAKSQDEIDAAASALHQVLLQLRRTASADDSIFQ